MFSRDFWYLVAETLQIESCFAHLNPFAGRFRADSDVGDISWVLWTAEIFDNTSHASAYLRLFVEEGVFQQPPSSHFITKPFCGLTLTPWVLRLYYWLKLIAHTSRHFIFYTTSPTPSRWNHIEQFMDLEIGAMNSWTKAEICKA